MIRSRLAPAAGSRLATMLSYAVPGTILVLGVVVSSFVAGLDRQVLTDHTMSRFQAQVDLLAADLTSSVGIHVGAARGAAGLMSGSDHVDQAEYSAGMAAMLAGDSGPALRATNFIRRLPAEDLAAAVSERRAGDPAFTVFPSIDTPVHGVVWLAYPIETNRAAIGFDVTSTAAAAALRRADATGKAVMSSALQLVQDPRQSLGFVVYVPVERPGEGTIGWTAAVFSGQGFVEESIGAQTGLAVRVVDLSGGAPRTLGTVPVDHRFGGSDLTAERIVSVYGREWRLEFEAAPGFRRDDEGSSPRLVFSMGLLITLLSTVLAVQARRSSIRAREMVAVRTNELAEANDALVTALEAKDTFLSVVSHEFRTPLTVIEGSADLMSDDDLDPDLRAALLERIHRNTRRLGTLVADLLVAAQIENGKLDVAPERVDISEVVGSIVGDLGHVATDVSYSGRSDVVALVDPLHLDLMVANLVSNADKYGAPPVEITGERVGDSIVVAVRDHGAGVPDEAVSRLFHRFEQADNSRTRQVRGVGLGLSIVDNLARLNGGSISYTGGPDGARFEITLPAVPVSTRQSEPV